MRIINWWRSKFLLIDLLLAITITIAFITWCQFFSGKLIIGSIVLQNRPTTFGTLATIYGTLLGFIITSVSIIIGYANNPRMDLVTHSKHYSDLWNTYIKTVWVLACATIFSIISLIFDHKNEMNWYLFYLNTFFMLLSIFRISRSIQLLEKVIKIITKPIVNKKSTN